MKKIIELSEDRKDYKCLICCKNIATTKFVISRPDHGDIVTSFHVCDQCLVQMQKDIQNQG